MSKMQIITVKQDEYKPLNLPAVGRQTRRVAV